MKDLQLVVAVDWKRKSVSVRASSKNSNWERVLLKNIDNKTVKNQLVTQKFEALF